jgi:hypothetical protein
MLNSEQIIFSHEQEIPFSASWSSMRTVWPILMLWIIIIGDHHFHRPMNHSVTSVMYDNATYQTQISPQLVKCGDGVKCHDRCQ